MNKIVRENYPVSKLPEDLREGFRPDAIVRVEIETNPSSSEAPVSFSALKERADDLRARPDFRPVSPEEAVARVRQSRDEWDD